MCLGAHLYCKMLVNFQQGICWIGWCICDRKSWWVLSTWYVGLYSIRDINAGSHLILHSSVKCRLLLYLFYRWGNWGREQLNNLVSLLGVGSWDSNPVCAAWDSTAVLLPGPAVWLWAEAASPRASIPLTWGVSRISFLGQVLFGLEQVNVTSMSKSLETEFQPGRVHSQRWEQIVTNPAVN